MDNSNIKKEDQSSNNAKKGMIGGAATGAIAGASIGRHMGLAAPHLARFIGGKAINASVPIAIVGFIIGGLLGDKIGGNFDQKDKQNDDTPTTIHWNPK